MYVKELAFAKNKYDTVGYNQAFKATKEMVIAIVNMGYADGLSGSLAEEAFYAFYKNQKCRVLGRIALNSCVIDISDIASAEVGDRIDIIDFQQQNLAALAKLSGMIPYEIICRIGPRVRKVYIQE